jgi:cysteinyl-tRNA synthetase
MDDDFNTAKAIAIMFDLVKQAKSPSASEDDKHKAAKVLVYIGRVLGFFQNLETKLHKKQPDLSDALMGLIINYRNEARSNKDWKTSDRIRDDLAALGIEIKDTPKGCIWTQKEQ